MKEKKKTIFTFKFPHSFLRANFPIPHEQGHRELRGMRENLISVFSHWSRIPSTQLCPMSLPVPTSSSDV